MKFQKIIGRLAFVLKRSKTVSFMTTNVYYILQILTPCLIFFLQSVEEISEKEAGPVSRSHSPRRKNKKTPEYDEMSDSSDSSFSDAWGLRAMDDDHTLKGHTAGDTDVNDLKVTVDQKLKEGATTEKKMIILP